MKVDIRAEAAIVLELGCGMGRVTLPLASYCKYIDF
jgi:tRNA G46 methylase TrmB